MIKIEVTFKFPRRNKKEIMETSFLLRNLMYTMKNYFDLMRIDII